MIEILVILSKYRFLISDTVNSCFQWFVYIWYLFNSIYINTGHSA